MENASVVQVFGVKNHRMAQDIANLIGGLSPEELLRMQQVLLIDGRLHRAMQIRHYNERQLFGTVRA